MHPDRDSAPATLTVLRDGQPATEPPLSGEALCAVPAGVKALLDELARFDAAAPLEPALARLLDILRETEPGSAVALTLRPEQAGAAAVVIVRAREPNGHASAGEPLGALAEQVSAPLPGGIGSLHLGAPRLGRLGKNGAALLTQQAAQIIAAAVGLARGRARAASLSEQIAQLHKLATLGQSAAAIVHELNNPLTAILAYGEYLARKLESHCDEPDLQRLWRIVEAAQRIQRYSRDLVDYSRPAGLRAPCDLHAVIDRALGFCMHDLHDAAIRVDKRFGDVPHIDGMDSPLTQVFVNLFTNAWHAMADHGGTLFIATRCSSRPCEGPLVIVEIADDGPGIAEEHLARIFDAYFTTKPNHLGTGLGLSIVRQIVSDHGGRIEARRREPQGALFRIELPAKG